MPAAGSEGQSFFQQYGHIAWPILGVLGALVLLIGGYAIWRGPHRTFLPASLIRRLRRDPLAEDTDDEKRFHPLGRVPSPVAIPSYAKVRRESRRAESAYFKANGMSVADEFKQQVVAARRASQLESARKSTMGMQWATGAPVVLAGEVEHGTRRVSGLGLAVARVDGSPVFSESGTLVGSPIWDEKETIIEEDEEEGDSTLARPGLPRRLSSVSTIPSTSADGSSLSSVQETLSLSPSISPLLPAVIAPVTSLPPRRSSITPAPYQPQARTREVRASRQPPAVRRSYATHMKAGEESDVW